MRRPFVHVDEQLAGRDTGDRVPLSTDELHHLRRVLRLGVGAPVELADGLGATVSARLEAEGARIEGAVASDEPPRPRLVLAQGWPKGRKIDEVVRRATELGVDELQPVVASRSVSRPDPERWPRARERLEAVVRSASEQARRSWRPVLRDPVAAECWPTGGDGGVVLVAHPGAEPLPAVLAGLGAAATIQLAVGPEGGWTGAELSGFAGRGARCVGMGPSVLRTEHAGAAALAVVAAMTGRWGAPAERSATLRSGR